MKQVLLAGTALVGAALFAAPASAELKLDLGGHFKGYGVYVNEDATFAGMRDAEFRKDTEIHFTGETTLDNGLTVGVHIEQQVETVVGDNNESYAYFSGGWGRVNFGNEDGAAYLLQVAAPSADSNVDGLRTYIRGFRTGVELDYDHAHFGNGPVAAPVVSNAADRLTYLSPKFNGFQAGVSYSPEASTNAGLAAMGVGIEDAWEIAARWDGEFSDFGISVGAGYSMADNAVAGGAEPEGWNIGANVSWNQFSFGAAYLDEEDVASVGIDTTTWVVGAAWDSGPYHVGASYLTREDELGAADTDRYKATIGAGYTFGPGMTFRGALAFGETAPAVLGAEEDFTQFTLGTDINF